MSDPSTTEFPWATAAVEQSHAYLAPAVLDILGRRLQAKGRVLDLGSGNGALTVELSRNGYDMVGVEPSASGVAVARAGFPDVRFEAGDGYEDLAARFGAFDAVVSCEVIEHLMAPARFLARIRETMKPGAIAILSTPYHGYLKNVAVAAAGKWDHHHHPEREYGHVKFFSRKTLSILTDEAGLREVEFHRVGRVPALAKSMIGVYAAAEPHDRHI